MTRRDYSDDTALHESGENSYDLNPIIHPYVSLVCQAFPHEEGRLPTESVGTVEERENASCRDVSGSITGEFQSADFGDTRLTDHLIQIGDAFSRLAVVFSVF